MDEPHQYLVDASGSRTHIVLTLQAYETLLARCRSSPTDDVPARIMSPAAVAGHEVALATAPEPASLTPSAAEEVFTYSLPRKGGRARGLWRFPTMLVLKGSTIADSEAPAMPAEYRRLRQKLIDIRVIERLNAGLTFTRDYPFDNPSIAACVVEGGSRDGYRSWKDSEGRTISDLGYSR